MSLSLRNLYVIVAKEVTADVNDQMISIFKVTDKFDIDINEAEFNKQNNVKLGKDQITLPVSYSVATSWIFDEKLKKETLITYKTNIVGPDGVEYGGFAQEQPIAVGLNRMNVNFVIQGLPVTGSGSYKFVVEARSKDDELLASGEFPFEIELKKNRTTTSLADSKS